MNSRSICRPCLISLGLALTLTGHAAFAGPGTQTEDDIYVGNKRQAQRSTTAAGTSATTPVPARASTSTTPKTLLPGTANATGHVLGGSTVARPVQGATSPGSTAPQPRPTAGVSPNTGALASKKTALSGGDDDLDDLEVERRQVQGVTTPRTTAPQIRPGAGTSPNTGRSATPAPAVLPGKP